MRFLFPRNIYLLAVASSCVKRVYLPLVVIYAVSVGVSIEQIGVIAGITALVSMLLEVPSGYFSDRVGHKTALAIGVSGVVFAPMSFVIAPHFWGVLGASLLYFGLMSFYTGTFEAIIHETLEEVGRDEEYASVYARVQRWSLMGNIILISVIPATYTFSPTMPFILATLIGCIGLVAVLMLQTPQIQREVTEAAQSFRNLISVSLARKELMYFVFLGVTAAHYDNLGKFKDLFFQLIGIPVESFGFIYACASIVGIGLLYTVPWLSRLSEAKFYILDLMFTLSVLAVVAFVSSLWIAIIFFLLRMAFYRVRRPVISQHLLRRCPDPGLKATYISLSSFLSALFSIFVPIVFGYVVGIYGLREGHLYYGIGALVLFGILYMTASKHFDFKR